MLSEFMLWKDPEHSDLYDNGHLLPPEFDTNRNPKSSLPTRRGRRGPGGTVHAQTLGSRQKGTISFCLGEPADNTGCIRQIGAGLGIR